MEDRHTRQCLLKEEAIHQIATRITLSIREQQYRDGQGELKKGVPSGEEYMTRSREEHNDRERRRAMRGTYKALELPHLLKGTRSDAKRKGLLDMDCSQSDEPEKVHRGNNKQREPTTAERAALKVLGKLENNQIDHLKFESRARRAFRLRTRNWKNWEHLRRRRNQGGRLRRERRERRV